MSDIEEDEIQIQGDDNAHQSCYVFQPFLADDLEPEKPVKKRRKTKEKVEEDASPFPLLNHGAESPGNSRLRYEKYRQTWEGLEARIEERVQIADQDSFSEVASFVNQPEQERTHRKLKIGLLLSGPDSGAQTRLLERLRSGKDGDQSQIFIQLRASHCVNLQTTLKSVIKSTINSVAGQDGYQSFVNKHKRLIPMPFDLELLQLFIKERDVRKIVISILDVETFDIATLSDLLRSLASWSSKIPFVALLGIATTVKLFESRLSRSTIEVLEAKAFKPQASRNLLEQILDDIQGDSQGNITFGPATITSLNELTQSQGMTVEAFTSAIKYAIMSHFFSNSLSVLSCSTDELQADKALCTAIRNTPSFQRYCEGILSSKPTAAQKKKVSELLSNDVTLLNASLAAAKPHSSTSTFPSSTFTLQEAFHLNSRQLLHPFTPRPRYALERALRRPVDYLGCSCCQFTTSSAPPTTILYTLLQEAGTVINVRDLYDAFCSRCFSIDPDESTEKADRTQLSIFYTALAELKMLGMVKSSTSAVIKKRAMALKGQDDGAVVVKGRDRYGDVDFIAKTGWAGL